jgi:hypothetical protein
MPGQTTTTTFNTLHPHTNGCTSLIFPNQSLNQTVNFSRRKLYFLQLKMN